MSLVPWSPATQSTHQRAKKRKRTHTRWKGNIKTSMIENSMCPSYPPRIIHAYSPVHRLLQMPEVEREEILSQRLEEKQQLLDKRLLSQMVQQQRGGGGDDSVAKAAKRTEFMVSLLDDNDIDISV